MRPGISISVTPADLVRLRALVKDRNAPQKHVWRAQIVMLSAEGAGTNAIMRETGKSKTCVWRWQERFAAEGVDGLLRDKTRPSRIPKLDPSVAERVVALTMEAPPHEATHWTGSAMAGAAGVSVSSVQRIWRAHGLQPHRVRQFKLSNDPAFVEKLRNIVGLYVDPPAHAVVRGEFRRDAALPILLSEDVFVKGIRKGVEQGEYVYQRGDLLYGPGDPITPIAVDEQAVVFTMAYARDHNIWPRTAPKPTGGGAGTAHMPALLRLPIAAGVSTASRALGRQATAGSER
jgi:transposase